MAFLNCAPVTLLGSNLGSSFITKNKAPSSRPSSPQHVRSKRCTMTISGERTAQQSTSTKAPATLTSAFHQWFAAMPGVWNSERTYHYLDVLNTGAGGREASQTTFEVARLSSTETRKVLDANGIRGKDAEQGPAEGMRVSFRTLMRGRAGSATDKPQYVTSSTDLVMRVTTVDKEKGRLYGDYYRSVGYEEGGPTASKFEFDTERMEMLLTTWYAKVVSVDRILLLNERFRTRHIVNYVRPPSGDAKDLKFAILCGFGVEAKGAADQRLVD